MRSGLREEMESGGEVFCTNGRWQEAALKLKWANFAMIYYIPCRITNTKTE